MKLFQCDNCASPAYFENTICTNCGRGLGYHFERNALLALVLEQGGRQWASADNAKYRYCANFAYGVCNWLLPADSADVFCSACSFNRMIPDLSLAQNRLAWGKLEQAKHRLVYTLRRLGLPLIPRYVDEERGLAFDFLSSAADGAGRPVRTGHDRGVITINLAEADSVHREFIRKKMSEPYRTLIGHFRHEIGHYYWPLLMQRSSDNLAAFRDLFGDETRNYGAALQAYYDQGPPADWQTSYITAYATAHSWEDWAETWAHYLHIMDTVETAYYFDMRLQPRVGPTSVLDGQVSGDPFAEAEFEKVLRAFIPITFAINSLNRGMGIADVYPFEISPPVREKLRFIHRLIRAE